MSCMLTKKILIVYQMMKQFFLAKDVPNAKKAVVFLSAIAARAYKLLRSLLAPEPPLPPTRISNSPK